MASDEHVRVVVRCRPMNRKEIELKCQNIVEIDNCTIRLNNSNDKNAPQKTFTFDNAYDPIAPTEVIYNDICYSLIESVLEGYNSTIFAYGQTGCGKSHTMQGPLESLACNEIKNEKLLAQRGIISRAFEHIFEEISLSSGNRYLVLVSYLEIYNEQIRDLLNPESTNLNLQLKEIPGEGIIVQSLSTHPVQTISDCENLLLIGSSNRMVGATQMNAGSSRSHSIFTLNLEQISSDNSTIKKGKLNLVDLAGSERQNKTGATGDRLKEATKINLSLSALGNVISALVDGKTKHIPYRDSKLTRLLQDSLGGNTKTLMISCVSPADYNYDETLSTLRYANRAKNISNKPKINEDPKDTMLREYQDEILKLKNLLSQKTNFSLKPDETLSNFDSSLENIEKLTHTYEEEKLKLKYDNEVYRKENEELQLNLNKLKEIYEEKLNNLIEKKKEKFQNQFEENSVIKDEKVLKRLEIIKNALIGGEKSDDVQLKEKRKKKKIDAEKRLSALANALNRVVQNEDRDILQGHYASIQQELQIKTESLKRQRIKVKGLEREVTDIQAEFQLDRSDYLDTIRRLEQNVKFYQQLLEKAIPLLRKDGRYWDSDMIKNDSNWNDDLKKWKIPDEILMRKKLPPAIGIQSTGSQQIRSGRESTSSTAPGRLESSNNLAISTSSLTENEHELNYPKIQLLYPNENVNDNEGVSIYNSVDYVNDGIENDFLIKKLQNSDSNAIVDSYFRPRRANELIHQNRNYNKLPLVHPTTALYEMGNNMSSANYIKFNKNLLNYNNHNQKKNPLNLNKTWNGASTITPNTIMTSNGSYKHKLNINSINPKQSIDLLNYNKGTLV